MVHNFWAYIHDSENTVTLGYLDALFFLAAILFYFLAWRLLARLSRYISGRKGLQYETLLPLKQVQAYLALIAPGLVLYYWAKMTNIIRNDLIETLFNLYVHIVILAVLERSVSSVQAIYNLHPIAEKRPIKGYVQFSKLMIYIVGMVVGVAILSGKSPWKIVN